MRRERGTCPEENSPSFMLRIDKFGRQSNDIVVERLVLRRLQDCFGVTLVFVWKRKASWAKQFPGSLGSRVEYLSRSMTQITLPLCVSVGSEGARDRSVRAARSSPIQTR